MAEREGTTQKASYIKESERSTTMSNPRYKPLKLTEKHPQKLLSPCASSGRSKAAVVHSSTLGQGWTNCLHYKVTLFLCLLLRLLQQRKHFFRSELHIHLHFSS